jgi:outer membrane receptor protein involved in Fe transport
VRGLDDSDNGFAATFWHLCSGIHTFACWCCRDGTRRRHWVEHSQRRGDGPESSGHLSPLPHNRAYASLFYNGPAETWLAGFDIGATVHYPGQYKDDNIDLTGSPKPQMPRSGPLPWRARKVSEWVTLDLIASYTLNLPSLASAGVPGLAKDGAENVRPKDGKEKNVMPVATAEYNPCGWRSWSNNTTISLGMQNVFDSDPPFVAGAFGNNYDGSLATIKGRFWYVQLKKRF